MAAESCHRGHPPVVQPCRRSAALLLRRRLCRPRPRRVLSRCLRSRRSPRRLARASHFRCSNPRRFHLRSLQPRWRRALLLCPSWHRLSLRAEARHPLYDNEQIQLYRRNPTSTVMSVPSFKLTHEIYLRAIDGTAVQRATRTRTQTYRHIRRRARGRDHAPQTRHGEARAPRPRCRTRQIATTYGTTEPNANRMEHPAHNHQRDVSHLASTAQRT